MTKAPTPYLLPPKYDIDALPNVDLTARDVAFKTAQTLWEAIDGVPQSEAYQYFRPDSSLLNPEVTLRDFCMFDTSMGNGWSTSLGYSNGLPTFFRGLRALRTIGHRRGIEMAEAVLVSLRQLGVPELTSFPDDPFYGFCDDWDIKALEFGWGSEEIIAKKFGPTGLDFDSQWWEISHTYWDRHEQFVPDDPPVCYTLCDYIVRNRELLRCRESPSEH